LTNLAILTEITETQYEEASLLWNLTGVGNPARGDTIDAVRQTLQNGGKFIILYEDSLAVGTVWLTHDFRRLYIHHMAVHPDWQHRGFGKALLKEALKIASELKLQAKLEVFQENTAAYELYTSFGFQPLENYHTLIKRDF
jgi:[ribosomal protein S18]-alanine N-acetyltransferase